MSAAEAGDFRTDIKIRPTTGNTFVDNGFSNAYRMLNTSFRVQPGFGFFDDSASPNALATTENLLGGNGGTVLFGLRLVTEEIQADPPTWGSALSLIMAHEWTHIAQYSARQKGTTRQLELHADFMAGWWLGMFNLQTAGQGINISSAARSVFNKGDFDYNNPDHHGEPQERILATLGGYELPLQGVRDVVQAFSVAQQKIK
ncbi:MAG TPA: hypothetical protein VI485_21525 [Vicinamibacterales bacterium]|nr:hypothetical protein [Vicinamibacterales bacterium]